MHATQSSYKVLSKQDKNTPYAQANSFSPLSHSWALQSKQPPLYDVISKFPQGPRASLNFLRFFSSVFSGVNFQIFLTFKSSVTFSEVAGETVGVFKLKKNGQKKGSAQPFGSTLRSFTRDRGSIQVGRKFFLFYDYKQSQQIRVCLKNRVRGKS